jgi:hypothetical protein
MASQNIYSVQLLNDLHNHFPEILYNSRRFQNVQDLLGYIRTVSEISPYDRGLHQYRMRQRPRMSLPNRYSNFNTTNPVIPVTGVPSTNVTNSQSTISTSIPVSSIPTRIRINTDRSDIMDSFIGGPSIILGGTNGGIMTVNEQAVDEQLQAFLNQSVPVYPTARDIDNASTTFITTEQQDDNCAICQDEIESNQSVRCLTYCNHHFHQICIDTWFQRNVHCPTCRHDIRIVNQD